MPQRAIDELRLLLSRLDEIIRQAQELSAEIETSMRDRSRREEHASNWRSAPVKRRVTDAR